jgi:hypothetical protein
MTRGRQSPAYTQAQNVSEVGLITGEKYQPSDGIYNMELINAFQPLAMSSS